MKRRLVTKLMMAAGVAAMAVTTIPASVFAAEDGGQTYGVTYWCESDFFKISCRFPSQKKQKLMEINSCSGCSAGQRKTDSDY